MISFELWDLEKQGLRESWESWSDEMLTALLRSTDGRIKSIEISCGAFPDGATRELPYTPDQWKVQGDLFIEGRLRELEMWIVGTEWAARMEGRVRGVSSPGQGEDLQLLDHFTATLTIPDPYQYGEAAESVLPAWVERAQSGATGGRVGPSNGDLTWWEERTGRHHYDFWPVAAQCIRGPDFALLLSQTHVGLLGGLEAMTRDCPCEVVSPIEGTDLVMIRLAEELQIGKELETRAATLGEYLAPLLDW